MKIYLAGPLFGIADRAHNLRLGKELSLLGHEVIIPQVSASKFHTLSEIVSDCAQNAEFCEAIVANIDGPDADSGTALEVGIAPTSNESPIVICVRTDFRTSPNQEAGINGMFQLSNEVLYVSCMLIVTEEQVNLFYRALAFKIDELLEKHKE